MDGNNNGEGKLSDRSSISNIDRDRWSRALARQSRIAAILTFLGGTVVLLSLWWSFRHLRTATLQLVSINQEVVEKQRQLKSTELQVEVLQRDVDRLDKEKTAYATVLTGVKPGAVNLALDKHPNAAALVLTVSIRTATPQQSEFATRVAQNLRSHGVVVSSIETQNDVTPPNSTQLRYFSHEEEKRNDLRSIEDSLAQMGIKATETFVSASPNQIHTKRRYFELRFAPDVVMPLTMMSSAELRSSAIEMSRKLHADVHVIDEIDDERRRAREWQRNLQDPRFQKLQKAGPDDFAKADHRFAVAETNYESVVNRIVQYEVPLASQYQDELVKRLGAETKPACDSSAASSNSGQVMTMLGTCSSNLERLARILPQ